MDKEIEAAIDQLLKERPDLLKESDIDWSRKNPCADCPFLKTSPYHNGVASSLPTYVDSIRDGSFLHTCHKTDNRESCDGPRNWKGKVQHCTGAILMLLRTGKGMDLQLPLLRAAEQGKIDLVDMTDRARRSKVVFTMFGLIEFYAEKLGNRVKGMKLKRRPATGKG